MSNLYITKSLAITEIEKEKEARRDRQYSIVASRARKL
jgi:hypothetical protein